MKGLVRKAKALMVPYLRGSEDIGYITDAVEKAFLDFRARILGLEQQTVESVAAPVMARGDGGSGGLVPGRLVHVRHDGVAVLAVNSDPERYCTHVVAGVLAGGELSCYGFWHWPVACKVDGAAGEQVPLWLSDLPGCATDVKSEGAAVVQRVGERMTGRDSGGFVDAVVKPEFYPPPKGEKGDTGPQGPEGPQGPQGPPGDPATIEVYGDPGSTPVLEAKQLQFVGAEVIQGIDEHQAIVTIAGGGGVDPVEATAGEPGIMAGMLVHVDSNGVAWKADGSSVIRYATHVVASVAADTASCVNVGTHDVLTESDSPIDHTNTYYLSATSKGYATPKPPAIPAGSEDYVVRQMVGVGNGERD